MSGFIVVHRSILDWEWFSDPKSFHIFMYLILKANHTPKLWQGHQVNRGELITSIANISTKTSHSIKTVRGVLGKLEKSGEICKKGTNKFTHIKVLKYELYQNKRKDHGQANEESNAQQMLNKGQQLNNDNNNNNDNNETNFNNGADVEIKLFLEDLFNNDSTKKSIEYLNNSSDYSTAYYSHAYSFTKDYIFKNNYTPEHEMYLIEFFENQEKSGKRWISSVDVVKHYLSASSQKFENLIKTENSINPETKQRKKVAEKKESEIFPEMPEDFKPLWIEWKQYRKDRKTKPYAGLKWEQMAVDKLLKLSNQESSIAQQILNTTYENNYEGFFPLKTQQNGNTNSTNNGFSTDKNGSGKVSGATNILAGIDYQEFT